MKLRLLVGAGLIAAVGLAVAWLRADARGDQIRDLEAEGNAARIEHIQGGAQDAQDIRNLDEDERRRELCRVLRHGDCPH